MAEVTLVHVFLDNRLAVIVGPPKAFIETLHINLLLHVTASSSSTDNTVTQSPKTSPTSYEAVLLLHMSRLITMSACDGFSWALGVICNVC